MKHLKDFNFYIKESNERDFEFSILSIFRPFAKLISNINVNSKLRNLINSYDEYLYNVYLEYLNRKTNISVAELDNSNVRVVNQDKKIEGDDLDDDSDTFEGDVSTSGESNNSTEGNASTSGEMDSPETKDSEKYSAKKMMNTESDFVDEVEQTYFAEMVDELVEDGNLYQLKQMRIEYSDALKKDTQLLLITKQDMNNVNKLKKKASEDILAIDKNSPNYSKLELKISNYNSELVKISDKTNRLNNKIGQHKWFLEEINKAITFVERIKREEKEKDTQNKTNSSTQAETSNREDEDMEIKEILEANEWLGGGVIDWSWTNNDMKKINDLINPFYIEEINLKAYIVINKSNNPDKFKQKWNLYLNSLYKKWYYTYDVRNLKDISPNLSSKNSNKKSKEELDVKGELAYSTLILEEIFKNLKSYPYTFKGLISDKNKYFILLSKNNLFLIKKILFDEEQKQYSFQLLSILKPNNDNTNFIIPKFFNGLSGSFDINVNDNKVSLYKEKRNYPILFIYDGKMYISEDFKDWDSISLKNCIIYSLKDTHFKEILKNSSISYDDILPSEEVFDKIKKTKLK